MRFREEALLNGWGFVSERWSVFRDISSHKFLQGCPIRHLLPSTTAPRCTMRLLQPRHTWCQFRHVFRRQLTTGPATFAQIRRELLGRQIPAKKEMVTEVRSEQLWQSITGLDVARNKVVYISHAKDNHKLLPQGHHLLYMAPTYHSSLLLPDGNDQTHAPGPPFTRRLWASGSVSFTPDWKTCMLLCRSRLLHCEESIVDVRLKSVPRADETSPSAAIGAGDKIFVDIARRYTMVSEYPPREIMTVINETRTLCFMTPRTADEVKADLEQLGDKLVKGTLVDYLVIFNM